MTFPIIMVFLTCTFSCVQGNPLTSHLRNTIVSRCKEVAQSDKTTVGVALVAVGTAGTVYGCYKLYHFFKSITQRLQELETNNEALKTQVTTLGQNNGKLNTLVKTLENAIAKQNKIQHTIATALEALNKGHTQLQSEQKILFNSVNSQKIGMKNLSNRISALNRTVETQKKEYDQRISEIEQRVQRVERTEKTNKQRLRQARGNITQLTRNKDTLFATCSNLKTEHEKALAAAQVSFTKQLQRSTEGHSTQLLDQQRQYLDRLHYQHNAYTRRLEQDITHLENTVQRYEAILASSQTLSPKKHEEQIEFTPLKKENKKNKRRPVRMRAKKRTPLKPLDESDIVPEITNHSTSHQKAQNTDSFAPHLPEDFHLPSTFFLNSFLSFKTKSPQMIRSTNPIRHNTIDLPKHHTDRILRMLIPALRKIRFR